MQGAPPNLHVPRRASAATERVPQSSPERHPRLLPPARTPARAPDSRSARERGAVAHARECSAQERGSARAGCWPDVSQGHLLHELLEACFCAPAVGVCRLTTVTHHLLRGEGRAARTGNAMYAIGRPRPGEPRGARLGQQGGATRQQLHGTHGGAAARGRANQVGAQAPPTVVS